MRLLFRAMQKKVDSDHRSLGEKLARVAEALRAGADATEIVDEDELDLLEQEQTMAPGISELPELLRATARAADTLRARVSSGGRSPRRDGLLIHLLANEWERAFDVRPAASRNGHFGRCLSILSNRIGIPSAGETYIASVLREGTATRPARQGAKSRE